jgi:lipopolysaccharide transport system permease protein
MPPETLLSPAGGSGIDAPISASAAGTERRPTLVLQPTSGWVAINFRELWQFRDLLLILIERDVKLRYKQTALGLAWVVIQPLVAAGIFTVIFGLFAKIPSGGIPYPLLSLSGLVSWTFFSGALQRASGSLVSNSQLISKVYFPRLMIPLAHTLAVLVDFAVMLALLFVLTAFYRIWPTWRLVTLPLFVVLGTLTATGVSLWLSAMSVKYRDFMYALPFMIQVWMYASPVVYPASIVPERWRMLYALNPLVGFVEGFRWCTLGTSSLDSRTLLSMVGISAGVALALFIGGAYFFRRTERTFADVI